MSKLTTLKKKRSRAMSISSLDNRETYYTQNPLGRVNERNGERNGDFSSTSPSSGSPCWLVLAIVSVCKGLVTFSNDELKACGGRDGNVSPTILHSTVAFPQIAQARPSS
jgi:hypothetical protein